MQEKNNKTTFDIKSVKAPEVKEAVKDAAKAVEAKAEAVAGSAAKTAEAVEAKAKEAGKAVAEKAEPVVKRRGRKPKNAAEKTEKAKKEKQESKTEIIVQYQENAISVCELEDKIKEKFVAEGHRAGCIKTFNVYVKPEEYKAYYVINDKFFGSVDLF